MDDKFPSDAADRFQVRMPPGLRERIADAARQNVRSMNAEIVARLEESLSGANDGTKERASQLADQIVDRVVERVEKIRSEAEAEIKALQEENRALREKASFRSPEP